MVVSTHFLALLLLYYLVSKVEHGVTAALGKRQIPTETLEIRRSLDQAERELQYGTA